jgi:hypothetical protein
MPNCHLREHVFEKGSATQAAAVATCAQVLMHVVGLIVVTALCSREVHCLRWHLRLDNSAANVEGLLLDPVMVASLGALIGLTVGMSLGTLGIGACICMEHVICLLSLVWGMGVLAGVCTLGTCCMLQMWSGVLVSSSRWRFFCMQTCVASAIHCKSCMV